MTSIMIAGRGLFFVVSSIVGVRLLLQARRNRALPEFALGFAFVVGGTLAGALGQFVQSRGQSVSPALLGHLTFVYTALSLFGMTAYNVFMCLRWPSSRWARCGPRSRRSAITRP